MTLGYTELKFGTDNRLQRGYHRRLQLLLPSTSATPPAAAATTVEEVGLLLLSEMSILTLRLLKAHLWKR